MDRGAKGGVRRGTEIEEANRGEEINKWGDTWRKTDTEWWKQSRQQTKSVEGEEERETHPEFYLLYRFQSAGKKGNVK